MNVDRPHDKTLAGRTKGYHNHIHRVCKLVNLDTMAAIEKDRQLAGANPKSSSLPLRARATAFGDRKNTPGRAQEQSDALSEYSAHISIKNALAEAAEAAGVIVETEPILVIDDNPVKEFQQPGLVPENEGI